MKLSTAFNWELGVGILEDNVFGEQPLPLLSPGAERRREPRITLSLPVRYRTKGKKRPWLPAHSVDVSRNGIRLFLDDSITVGTQIDLDVKLPQISKTVRLEGIIVWTNPSLNDPSSIECGVAFKNLRRLSNREKIMYFMADRICGLAAQQSRHLTCRPARTLEDIKKAYHLVYQEYSIRGYCPRHASEMHYNWYCMLPSSQTFLLEREGKLLGTISLLIDSMCGLPLDSLFKDEVDNLRSAGKRIAEVGLLALNGESFPKKSFSLTDFQKLTGSFRLFKILFDYARQIAGVTDIIIGVHPKHRELYRYLTFDPLGPVKAYPGACGHPALPMHLDIARAIQSVPLSKGPGYYFLTGTTPENILRERYGWTSDSVYEFMVQIKPLWSALSAWQRNYFLQCYPYLTLPEPGTARG